MENTDLKALEDRVDRLVARCRRLEEENRVLRNQHSHLITERAALIEKTEHARNRVEAMITRLKSMEL
jgi:cell division protein ZapB